jgi:protein TonB
MEARAPAARPSLMGELFDRNPKRRSFAVFAWVLALAGHSLAATFAMGSTGPRHGAVEPVDLEFIEPEPPAPEPEPAPPPEPAPLPEQDTPVRSVPRARPEPPPPAPAAAGALLTAKEDPHEPQATEELVDFASDPNSHVYGGGVVAVGGTGTVGGRGVASRAAAAATRPAPPPPPPRSKDVLTPAADLSQKPHLNESDPCRGFFPQGALDDTAQVGVMVVVAQTGSVEQATVVLESPGGQGFGNAARACMLSKRFTPARDRSGDPTATAVRVNVRFRR